MISNEFSLNTKILNKHLLFWDRNGRKQLVDIYEDKHEIYKYLLSKPQYNSFRFINKYFMKVIFGESNDHREIVETLNSIKFNLDSHSIKYEELVKKWPLKTDTGLVSLSKTKMNKYINELCDVIVEMQLEAKSMRLSKFELYLSKIILMLNPVNKKQLPDIKGVLDRFRDDIFIMGTKKTSYTMKKLCEKIFDYKEFRSTKNDWGGIEFLTSFKNRICPFCGRQYTTLYINNVGETDHTAQLDHYFPKDKYPYFGISLYNLNPICAWCNRKKSNYDSITNTEMINPHLINNNDIEFMLIDIRTKREYVTATDVLNNKDYLRIKLKSKKFSDELKATKNAIYIEEIYQSHIGEMLELLELIEKCNLYYVDDQVATKIFETNQEVELFMFGNLNNSEDGGSPLTKLKKSILKRYYLDFKNLY